MFKRALLILAGLFLATVSAWAGRCGPPSINYNSSADSYIVIEGTINGLPSSYLRATPIISLSLPGKPSSCGIGHPYIPQTPIHPYYCSYIIFINTANKRECWEYFQNLNTLTITIHGVQFLKTRSESETWIIQGTSRRTLTLGPVRTR